jgi:hypothetical protein
MWPWLLIVGIGRRRRFPLPAPFFLLWPLVLLGWLIFGVGLLFTRRWRDSVGLAGLHAALTLFPGLTGLRVDVDPRRGPGLRVRVM